jgi:glycosyltransferase involved in cell wall biosynthesis
MKVLYLGVYKDGTGWGNAAQNNILALDRAGVDVVPRSITLSRQDNHVDIPARILELEENDESGCDACIQHVLPNTMEAHGTFDKNIGIYYSETSHFRHTEWAEHLSMMDQVWVTNQSMISAALNSYVMAPMAVVPLCFDPSTYSQHYAPYPIPEAQDKFVFYTISTLTRRKNLTGLLKAFHLEFTPHEPVCLLIKSNLTGQSPMEASRQLKVTIEEVKRSMRLYPKPENYHNEILITQWLDTDKLMRLHKTGDCFVLPSYGEAWGIPGFEAMAMGNPVILTDEGGPKEYVEHMKSGILTPCRDEPVFIRPEEAPVPGLWTSDENWSAPDIHGLRAQMRTVYEDKDLRESLGSGGIDRAYDFSLDAVGQQMKGLLDETTTPTLYNRSATLREKHDMSAMVR